MLGGYETIEVDVKDGVAVLTLNRPEHRNSVDDRMHSELTAVFVDLRRGPAKPSARAATAARRVASRHSPA